MPCRDYENFNQGPSQADIAAEKSRKLLKYIHYIQSHTAKTRDLPTAPRENVYKRLDRITAFLCEMLTNLSAKQMKKIVYNPYDRTARNLANWWEDHQEEDKLRIAEEKKKKHEKKVRKAALAKLTKEERRLLNL